MSEFEIQRLMPRHKLMIDLSLQGLTNREIAEHLGVTPVTVNSILSCVLGQAELNRRRSIIESATDKGISQSTSLAKQLIEDAQVDAALTMKGLLTSQDESVKFRSAKDILDRAAGHSGGGTSSVVVLSGLKVSAMILALQEATEDDLGQGSKSVVSEILNDNANLALTNG